MLSRINKTCSWALGFIGKILMQIDDWYVYLYVHVDLILILIRINIIILIYYVDCHSPFNKIQLMKIIFKFGTKWKVYECRR